MEKCKNCGSEDLDGAISYCYNCGTNFKKDVQININEDNCFQTLSIWKLFAMSIFTFGLYDLFWFYRTWETVQKQVKYKISPFWRAFFSNITSFSLFPVLNNYVKRHNDKEAFHPILLAVILVIVGGLEKLPDPYWLISYFSVIVLMFLQNKINKINQEFYPNASQNKWNGKNIVILVLGFVWLAIAILAIGIDDKPAISKKYSKPQFEATVNKNVNSQKNR